MTVLNVCLTVVGIAGAWGWTKFLSILATRGKLSRNSVRKIVHMTAAPLMMMTWPLYTNVWYARALAAVIPGMFVVRLTRASPKDELCGSVSRSGNIEESRGGPAAYCISMVMLIITFWRSSPEAYIGASMMCFGDGMADVVGSAVKGIAWPLPKKYFYKRKSIAGSLALFLAGTVGSYVAVNGAVWSGASHTSMSWAQVASVATICTIVETLPLEDNFAVPATAAAATRLIISK